MMPVRTAAVLVGALLLQLTLVSQFSYEGARPEILILVVLAAGYLVGPDEGAIVGFIAGLAFDVFLSTPFGLTAFIYTVAGYAIARVTPSVVRATWWITALVLATASAVTMLGYALVGQVIGLETLSGPAIGTVMAVVGLVNLVLAPLAAWLVQWTRFGDRSRRRQAVYA